MKYENISTKIYFSITEITFYNYKTFIFNFSLRRHREKVKSEKQFKSKNFDILSSLSSLHGRLNTCKWRQKLGWTEKYCSSFIAQWTVTEFTIFHNDHRVSDSIFLRREIAYE